MGLLGPLILSAIIVATHGRRLHDERGLTREMTGVKRGGVPVPKLVAIASKDDENEAIRQKRLVEYLDFEKMTGNLLKDSSGYENDAMMDDGALVMSIPGSSCGQVAYLASNDIHLSGDTFQAKPRYAVTIAAWICLIRTEGSHSLFDTIGSTHPQGQYHLEVNYGVVRWFHRNETQHVIFETMAHEVPAKDWVHIAGTYDSKTGQAKIYINGELRNMSVGSGMLSRDWTREAMIGNHNKQRPLKGFIDEFRIYNYALKVDEIKALVQKCKFDKGPSEAGKTSEESLGAASEESKGPSTNPSPGGNEADANAQARSGKTVNDDRLPTDNSESVLKKSFVPSD